ncbi:myb-related transcription factor, partner of profilin-like [Ambystoma mexicanum]|uniref:myb-related transcription factor, partner of profilin-like n=1 Tax=Ambystoma mexicanum TaxID=8296 RepID=UPI0037E801D0
MSKPTRKSTPRMRKKRFSDEELNMVAETLVAHTNDVFANDLKRAAQLRKKEIWEEVGRKVTAVGTTTSTVKDCKKRCDDLRLRVRNILSANRREAMATGTDAESEGQEPATKATTSSKGSWASQDSNSRATPTPRLQHRPAPAVQGRPAEKEKTCETPPDDTATTELSTVAEAEGDDTQSAATSSIGEVAASAPLSDVEGHAEEYLDMDNNLHVGTPVSPMQEHAVVLGSPHLSSPSEGSPALARPATAPSTSKATTNMEARLTRVEARQDSMIDLVRQYVAEGELSRCEIRKANAANIIAMNTNTMVIRYSLAAVTQALGRIVEQLQQQQPAPTVAQASISTPSTTPASTIPASPVRMTRCSACHMDMLPPDPKRGRN